MLNGETIDHVDEKGERVVDDTFLILLNCHHESIKFFVPPGPQSRAWEIVIDTNRPEVAEKSESLESGEPVELVRQSLVLLREQRDEPVMLM